jgi:hypothetical protein
MAFDSGAGSFAIKKTLARVVVLPHNGIDLAMIEQQPQLYPDIVVCRKCIQGGPKKGTAICAALIPDYAAAHRIRMRERICEVLIEQHPQHHDVDANACIDC